VSSDGRRFRVRRGDRRRNWFALVLDGDELIYGGRRHVQRLAAFFNAWNPSDEQLANFLAWSEPDAHAYVSTMRRITLRWPATCARCDQPLAAGARATWDPASGLVVHGQRCPLTPPTTSPDAT